MALKQASMTEAALAEKFPDLEVERVVIKTTGDIRTDVALKDVSTVCDIVDKGVFIKELEVALLKGEIDFAVHSLKDVPTVLESAFELVCMLPRASRADVLVTKQGQCLKTLRKGARVATSSVRRERQLLHLRPDLEIVDIRGNVPTRLEKLAVDEDLDAIMLAEAGLVRLGYDFENLMVENVQLSVDVLDTEVFLPAAGQGAVAMEVRQGDEEVSSILRAISCEPTTRQVVAEREFLRLLDAGCHTPVGVSSRFVGEELEMKGIVFAEGELAHTAPKEASVSGPLDQPLVVGQELFKKLK